MHTLSADLSSFKLVSDEQPSNKISDVTARTIRLRKRQVKCGWGKIRIPYYLCPNTVTAHTVKEHSTIVDIIGLIQQTMRKTGSFENPSRSYRFSPSLTST